MTTDIQQQQKQLNSSTNQQQEQQEQQQQQQQQQGNMLLLEPYQPTVFMEDDWDNSLCSVPSLTNDEEDLFARMDFVDVSFSSLPPTPSNSAPQSPSIPSDKSMNHFDNSSAEELLSMLMETYCPHISST
ncbi:hypothetical protein INT45_005842 [Circinella minor]|uniref:Uncharacterized protein n=1 Tax=Circinella minor TaxID=1195481 RepID=A0A8H7VIS8_9FUNG|nr:hypothetical protein INT45_005842 [Circinella minor]